ncbi:MAG TPA: hypothetical protein ENJ00_06680 [Phycisphaerales bacterium]|nr:hypothetical protein [Phycisphaerales bacterium]
MIYDISPPLSPDTAVFPGDTPLSREVLLDLARGDGLTLSTLRSTVHLGAHADGPNHYALRGRSVDEQPLERYLGRCQVVACASKPSMRLEPADLLAPISEPRVLLKTGSWPDPTTFNRDFVGLAVGLVSFLADAGVRTIGIDTPSVDLADSQDLPAHHAIFEHDIAILECLDLAEVPPGSYELIALPLKLVGFDASPVRAILRSLQ